MFSRFGIFLEISYELELVPQALTVVLGVGENKYDAGGHPCCVPYWYLLPRNRPEHRGQQIKFKTEADLEALLLRFKDDFLEPYAKSLWLNLDSLEQAIQTSVPNSAARNAIVRSVVGGTNNEATSPMVINIYEATNRRRNASDSEMVKSGAAS